MVRVQHEASILGQMPRHLVVLCHQQEVYQELNEVVRDHLALCGLSLDHAKVLVLE